MYSGQIPTFKNNPLASPMPTKTEIPFQIENNLRLIRFFNTHPKRSCRWFLNRWDLLLFTKYNICISKKITNFPFCKSKKENLARKSSIRQPGELSDTWMRRHSVRAFAAAKSFFSDSVRQRCQLCWPHRGQPPMCHRLLCSSPDLAVLRNVSWGEQRETAWQCG